MGGFEVGKGRVKNIEQAKNDGEEDVEERYALPNLYAQGTSANTKAYNAMQRAHQHIFENFTTASIFAMAGALEFPISTALSTVGYAVGRIIFSSNYSKCEGDISQRYSKNQLAKFMWHGLLTNMFLGVFSCFKILASTRLEK